MIGVGAKLHIVDNSGAKEARCIKVLRSKKFGKIGDYIVLTVLKVRKAKKKTKIKIKKGNVIQGIVVMTKKLFKRRIGYEIGYHINGAIITNKQTKAPFGTRYYGLMSIELRDIGWMRSLSLTTKKNWI
jgi:large subunit ribosomal protein L14